MGFRYGYNKFKAQKTEVSGSSFPSKLEAAVYYMLLTREKSGELHSIMRQQQIVLQDGPREVRISWRVDFSFVEKESGQTVFVEAKGFPTNEYKLKLKMFRKNPTNDLEIWGGDYKRPRLIERIKKA